MPYGEGMPDPCDSGKEKKKKNQSNWMKFSFRQ